MIRQTASSPQMPRAAILLALLALCVLSPAVHAAPLAEIKLLAVTQRTIATAGNPVFDEVSSGLNVTAVGAKVYLEAETTTTVLSGYKWMLLAKPTGSAAVLSATSGTLVTLRPDVAGNYSVALIPLDLAGKSTEAFVQALRAGTWVGVGTINTHATPTPRAPQCGTGFCHGGGNAEPELNVTPDWAKSGHSRKLEDHMNGVHGSHYSVSCLSCHTLGYNTNAAALNNGFDDVAKVLNYDLAQIPALVEEAALTKLPMFPQLPATMQAKANIQCESCHGPGSLHPSGLQEADRAIAGVDLGVGQCAQCHDSATGYQQIYWQWSTTRHNAANGEHMADNASCTKCHTGEGFVDQRVKGKAAVAYGHESNPVTCSTCHDPHYSDNPHQLRLVGNFTFDSGQTYNNPGMGGLCLRCHSGRVSNVNTSINSSRGAHYGNQGDMLLGINGYKFGLTFTANSDHTTSVSDTCVHCHMAAPTQSGAGVITPAKVGGHTWQLRDDMGTTATQADDVVNAANACNMCHTGLNTLDRTARADYDGDGSLEGVQTEVKGLMEMLRLKILELMPGTSMDPVSGKIAITTAGFTALNTTKRGVFYNWNFVWTDGSFGVHNTAYAVQLLQHSYTQLTGHPITDDYPAMVLRAPVKPKNDAQDWKMYN